MKPSDPIPPNIPISEVIIADIKTWFAAGVEMKVESAEILATKKASIAYGLAFVAGLQVLLQESRPLVYFFAGPVSLLRYLQRDEKPLREVEVAFAQWIALLNGGIMLLGSTGLWLSGFPVNGMWFSFCSMFWIGGTFMWVMLYVLTCLTLSAPVYVVWLIVALPSASIEWLSRRAGRGMRHICPWRSSVLKFAEWLEDPIKCFGAIKALSDP